MKNYEGQSIIFVCTGNTCRSPMAEAIFRWEAKRRGLPVTVTSAGTDVAKGSGMHLHSLRTLANHGLTVENFSSTELTAERISQATAIVCMTAEQKARIVYFCDCLLLDEAKGKIYAFADFCGYSIPDPYGYPIEAYEATFSALEGGMSAIIDKLFPVPTEEAVVAEPQAAPQAAEEAPKPKKPRKPRSTTAKPSTGTGKSTAKPSTSTGKPAAKPSTSTGKPTAKPRSTPAKASGGQGEPTKPKKKTTGVSKTNAKKEKKE